MLTEYEYKKWKTSKDFIRYQQYLKENINENDVEKWVKSNFKEVSISSDIGKIIGNYLNINFDKDYFWKYKYGKFYNISDHEYILNSINKDSVNNILLWHGTPYYNIKSLIENNFNEKARKSKLGKGIYFTENPQIACNFASRDNEEDSISGYILLCNISLGNIYNVFGGEQRCSKYAKNNNYNSIKNNGNLQTLSINDIIIKNINKNINIRIPSGTISSNDNNYTKCNSVTNEYVILENKNITIDFIIEFTREKLVKADIIVNDINSFENVNLLDLSLYKDHFKNKDKIIIAYIQDDNIEKIMYKSIKK